MLDLFSGIGGFSLGLERSGMETVAFCEIEPYCQKVLKKHWPHVPIHTDIRELDGTQYRGTVELVCGGFPCQDISSAGTGEGLDGDRSGLWFEYARIIREVGPRFVLVENSPELVHRGLATVLGNLADAGLDAEWGVISACAVGASHMRRRLWIVAYADSSNGKTGFWDSFAQTDWALRQNNRSACARASVQGRLEDPPRLFRGVDDVPLRMDRVRALGNAVVPQIPEILGRAIIESLRT